MLDERVSTGIPGLDEVFHGGLIKNNSYLLVGSAGTGKTILSLKWLLDGSARGERGLYITLAEPESKIAQNVASFGWDLGDIQLADLTINGELGGGLAGEYHIFPPSDVEQQPVWQSIYQAIEAHRPQRVVIDSVTQLRYLSTDEYQFRKQLLSLVGFLHQSGCTALLAFEPTELEREASVALAVDGIVRLRMQISENRVIGLRSIQIEKLRGSDFMSGYHPLRISSEGIVVYPHRIEEASELQIERTQLTSGTKELDDLLSGGLETATTTLITGPAGVGKSTLTTQFLLHSTSQDHRAVFYLFEESVDSVMIRSRGTGLAIDEAVRSGALKLQRVNPMKLYPDEFLGMIRRAVEEEGRKIVAIDSLRGYGLAMEEFGTTVAHIQNMVNYLNCQGVTTFLLNEVEYITGDFKATEIGMSHLADNIIILRHAEYAGRVIKVIGCLKKRLGDFQPELRQLHITANGIQVSGQLANLRGILTGVPAFMSDAPH